jgi:diguanylate cyclase (GGDEF)-like protein
MSKILVVDDEPFIVEMIEENLNGEGYEIVKAYTGEEALQMVEQAEPDLVILDLMLPGMDGYEVCRQLQRDSRFNHIPVIMLTAKSAIADRVSGYDKGADDYITKPFDPDELLIRVRAQLRHLDGTENNVLTGLPGSSAVEAMLSERTENPELAWSIVYVDIERFTAYNEVYSFVLGEELIRQAANCLKKAVRDFGNEDDFLGHIGGDDFVVLTTPDKSEAISECAIGLFKEVAPNHYNATDRANGYFFFLNHAGENVQLPLVELFCDIVDNLPE